MVKVIYYISRVGDSGGPWLRYSPRTEVEHVPEPGERLLLPTPQSLRGSIGEVFELLWHVDGRTVSIGISTTASAAALFAFKEATTHGGPSEWVVLRERPTLPAGADTDDDDEPEPGILDLRKTFGWRAKGPFNKS